MRGVVMYAAGDVRVEDRPEPTIVKPTDAIIRLSATCICGSDLWPYRGADPINEPSPMGHEYAGIVEEVGSEVTTIRPGQFVVGSFFASDNTCEICRAGYHTSCVHREILGTSGAAQAQRMRAPLADGTLVPTPTSPTTTWCRTSWPPPTCSAPAGSPPWPPRPAPARPSRWSATAPSGCSGCSPPNSWAPTGSSR
jgi:threonine dehydrogenase-like Zn-dependent dehydrogenase